MERTKRLSRPYPNIPVVDGLFSTLEDEAIQIIVSMCDDIESTLIFLYVNKRFNKVVQTFYPHTDAEKTELTPKQAFRSVLKSLNISDDEFNNNSRLKDTFSYFKRYLVNHLQIFNNQFEDVAKELSTRAYYNAFYNLPYHFFGKMEVMDFSKLNTGFRGLTLIRKGIFRSECLKSINLSFNNLGDESCYHIKEILEKSKSIELIALECNRITDAGLAVFSEAMIVAPKVNKIKLALNVVTVEGLKELVELIQKKEIRYNVIDLKYNNIVETEGVDYFEKYKISIK